MNKIIKERDSRIPVGLNLLCTFAENDGLVPSHVACNPTYSFVHVNEIDG